MKTKKAFVTKVLAFILSLMLVFSAFPVAALAAVEEPSVNAQAETEAETSDTEQESYAAPTEYSEEALEPEVEPEAAQPTEEVAASEPVEPVEETVVPTEDKTDVAAVAAPEEEVKPTEPPMEISDGYYLFGPKKGEADTYDWSDINNVKANEKFSLNTENEDEEEYMLFAKLAHYRRIKVVEVKDNKIVHYYPDGLGNEYVVSSEYTGNVVIFFTTTPNTKEDWAPFGKYFYISKTITKKSDDGSETTVPVEKDTKKPTLSVLGYAYKDGDNMVDWDNSSWIEGSKKPYVKVEAKDEGSGINENSFLLRWNSNNDQTRPRVVHDKDKASVYYLELPGSFTVRAGVEDQSGNKSDEQGTEKLKIDYAAPTKDDVVKGVFSAQKGNLDDILNVLSFGLYSNNQIAFTVYVSSNDGSPITEINLVDGDEIGGSLKKHGGVRDNKDGFYTQKFLIEPKDESIAEKEQPYNLKVSTVTDTCYAEATVNKSILDLDLYADNSLDSSELKVKNKEIYELVNTLIKPSSEIKLTGDQGGNGIYTSKDNAVKFSADISDSVSGISEKDGDVRVYVGLSSELKMREDGTYNVGSKNAVKFSAPEESKNRDGSGELSGKLLSEIITGEIPVDRTSATGEYRIVTVVKNNSNNVGYNAVDFVVDNDVPVISEDKVLYQTDDGTYTDLSDWTNKPVRIQFKATDAANTFNMGIKPENITVTGSVTGDGAPYAVSAGEDADVYYFDIDLYQDYTITVSDEYGHKNTLTISQDRVLYDIDAPVISDVKYDNVNYTDSTWHTKETGVKISFKVTDFCKKRENVWLSGKDEIIVKVTGEDTADYAVTKSFSDSDGWTCSFKADKYQKYKIDVADKTGNASAAVSTEKAKVDSGAPNITKVRFRSEASTTMSKLLNILTFGIYHNKQIIMRVEVTDSPVSSGIRDISAKYSDGSNIDVWEELTLPKGEEENTKKNVKGYKEFVLSMDKEHESDSIMVLASDNAGYNTGKSLTELNQENVVITNGISLDEFFEIVSTKNESGVLIDFEGQAYDEDKNIYYGTVKTKATIKDTLSGIAVDSDNNPDVQFYFDSVEKFEKSETTDAEGKPVTTYKPNTAAKITPYSKTAVDHAEKLTDYTFEYTVDESTETGKYMAMVVVKNNSGNTHTEIKEIYIDNDPPVFDEQCTIDCLNKIKKWSKENYIVEFAVFDEADSVGLGVNKDTITITGSINKMDYRQTISDGPIKTFTKDGKEFKVYTFVADYKQEYTITAKDACGHESEALVISADDILIDKEAPVISGFTYDYKDKDTWKQKEEGVNISFSVHDRRMIDGKYTEEWLSGKDGKDCTMTVKVKGESIGEKTLTSTVYDSKKDCFNFTFNTKDVVGASMLGQYQKYTVTATDPALNSAEATTETAKVDEHKPEITKVSFRTDSDAADKFLNFLTFGLYSNDYIVMTVTAHDASVSSGFREITAYDKDDNPLAAPSKDNKNTNNSTGGSVAVREFKLDKDIFYNGENITVKVVDNAEYDNGGKGESLYTLKQKEDGTTKIFDTPISLDLDEYFEIVGSEATATIDEKSIEYNGDDPNLHSYTGRWYPGDVIDQYNIQDSTTKINSVKVELNGADITSACVDDTGEDPEHPNTVPDEYSHWNKTDSGAKISNLNIKYDSSTPLIAENLHRTSDDGKGENHVVVTVVSNNGCSAEKPIDAFYIDNTIPTITGIDFEGYSTDKPTGGAVMKTTYGYYFKNSTKVTVTANDIGSGVNNIHLYGIRATAEQGTINFDDTKVETAEKAEFTIPANFKGQLVAYAYDNVNNRSLDYNPDGLIVESEATHPNVSGSKITINTNPVGSDQDGVKLFSGDVSVSFDIYDMYSGLKDVSYRIIDTANPNPEFITVNTNDTPVNASYVGDWRIDNIDSNLAHRISRTITVAAQEHNDNGVKIQLKGTDRAGFEIPMIEETISIDITKPIIKVEYDPVSPTDTHNGENYFNNTRTATITVTERNFNPDQIDWSKFVALEGSRPSVVGISNWSASYAIGTASAVSPEQRTAVHTAQITFADDGKFELDFDYTDLAGNSATKDFEVQKFYIDKTKPVMTVEMKYSSSPRYSQDNMATIRIVEHNFDPDSAHFTYSPTATGPDYASGGTAPTVGAWSSSGDEHTATINFPDEGKYSFKLTFKDLATNAADDYSEPEFYVDHTAEKPVFDETKIKDHFAYDSVVTPAVIYHDNSFNSGNYSFKLTRHAYDFEKMEQVTENVKYANSNVISKNSATGLDDGARVDYENFPNQEIADGIYTLYAEYTDLANNHADNSITFSVNRFGSVFLLGNVTTTNLVDREYTNEAPDVVIREISAIQHKSNSVSLSYNSSSKKLDDKQYKVDSPNTVGRWYEYLYDVFADNFKNEGEYTVTVSSRYSVGGKDKDISNRTANTDGQVERNCPVSFIVDKTTPTVSISGVENGKFYSEAEKNLKIICTDDNIDKESLVVKLDDQVIDLEKYGATVNEDLFGEIDVDLPIAADGKQTEHSIVVEVKDLAGNDADNAVNAFTLSATFLTMFFHNPVALGISGAVLAALIGLGIVLVLKKRKKA